jgi:hypothetical protein
VSRRVFGAWQARRTSSAPRGLPTVRARRAHRLRRAQRLSSKRAHSSGPPRNVSSHVWLVSFMDYDLGYFDDETSRLEPIDNPFGATVLPMRPEQNVTYPLGIHRGRVVGATGFEPATPCAQERGLASSCDGMRNIDGLQLTDPKRFDAFNRRTSLGRIHGWNPAGTPRDTVFLAAFGAMTPVLDPNRCGCGQPPLAILLADRRWPH